MSGDIYDSQNGPFVCFLSSVCIVQGLNIEYFPATFKKELGLGEDLDECSVCWVISGKSINKLAYSSE